jgi:two-component system chemotaxis response regulator CheB
MSQSMEERAPIRLMIVDDSQVARAVLSRMISAHKEFEVVALAANATEALEGLAGTKVDIVLLDVEMPGTSGLEALPEILEKGDGAQVLIVSSICEDGAEATVKALALGAADTLPKPGTGNFAGRFAEVLAERLRKIGRASRERATGTPGANVIDVASFSLRPMPEDRLDCLALGASTGGLHALNEFFAVLPAEIGAPILITQHLPPVFMPYFARQIETASGRTARVAIQGLRLRPDEIIVASGEAHLGLKRHGNYVTVEMIEAPASSGCMPSVDTMLSGMADIYGPRGLGIVFSGMGRDGLVGSARVVDQGGAVIVQDQQTCAVWGMPRAVADAGLASSILNPAELAGTVAGRAQVGSWK